MTPLLRAEVTVPACASASSSSTSWPLSARARAAARPTTPAPMTRESTRSVICGSTRAGAHLQDFAGVHDAVRIEGLLHATHEVELDRIRIALELEDLELADAVLGREAAAEILHEVVDRAAQLGLDGL